MTDISPSLQCEMYRSANSVRYLALRSASEFPFSTRITPRRLTLTGTECNCQLHFHRPACHLQSSFGRLIGIPFVQTKPNPRGWVNDPEKSHFPRRLDYARRASLVPANGRSSPLGRNINGVYPATNTAMPQTHSGSFRHTGCRRRCCS